MRRTCGLALGLLLWSNFSVLAAPEDDAAIRAVEQRQQTAWNSHDAHAYANLFAPDADVVNVLGWWWKSRDELEQKLGGAFAAVFAQSVLTVTDVETRYLQPDIAIAHVRWTMTGAKAPDGNVSNIPQQGLQTQVLTKKDGVWTIAAFQNTNGVPERSFGGGQTP